MARGFMKRGLFQKPKNEALARKISIRSPAEYQESIRELSKGGITPEEKRALVLARTRAQAQVRRKNLSLKERREFLDIAQSKLPPITRRKRR